MALNIGELVRRAKDYVELEVNTKVRDVTFAEKFRLFGREDIVLSVSTTDKEESDWWVVGGSTTHEPLREITFSNCGRSVLDARGVDASTQCR